MSVKYEVDGNVFREITEKWPFAYVKEYLIKARVVETDPAGNTTESFRLNDGRCFSRLVAGPRSEAMKKSNTRPRHSPMPALRVGDQSITQPR